MRNRVRREEREHCRKAEGENRKREKDMKLKGGLNRVRFFTWLKKARAVKKRKLREEPFRMDGSRKKDREKKGATGKKGEALRRGEVSHT